MGSRTSIALGLAGISLAIAAFAAGSVVFQKKGETSFTMNEESDGRRTYTTKEHRYEHVASFGGADMLLDIEKSTSYTDGLEGVRGELTASAFVNGAKVFDRSLWVIKDEAQAYEVSNDPELFITEQAACCGAEDTHRAYDLRTGKYLLSYNAFLLPPSHIERMAPFSIEIPNSSIVRFIGVLSSSAGRDLPDFTAESGQQLIGVITYASLRGPIVKAAITVSGGTNFYPSVAAVELVPSVSGQSRNEIRDGRHLVLWDLDGLREARLVSGFALRLNAYLERETPILIPFKNDLIDVAGVQAPAGVRVTLLK